jgi:hypothetical protein
MDDGLTFDLIAAYPLCCISASAGNSNERLPENLPTPSGVISSFASEKPAKELFSKGE